jgi:hypothetical protein
MEPSKKFFREFGALVSFVGGTIALILGFAGLSEGRHKEMWWAFGFSTLLYGLSVYSWRSSIENRRRPSQQDVEQEYTHRNPPAKLPPLRPE